MQSSEYIITKDDKRLIGSSKDVIIKSPAFENKQGRGLFHFLDFYSIFDWGRMPDQIKNKGRALAAMSAFNFKELEKRGIQTHFRGLLDDIMSFDLANVYKPTIRKFENPFIISYDSNKRTIKGNNIKSRTEYDYSFFKNNKGEINNYLVPLEIIFRNGLPKGSSVFKKLKEAEGDQEKTQKILHKLGLDKIPKEGDMLPKPIVEYTTKLEATDRKLDLNQAYEISGLSSKAFEDLSTLALNVNDCITERTKKTGLGTHWDGKIEVVYFNKKIILADAMGNLDENRIGTEMSKEFFRQGHKVNQSEWIAECEKYKPTGEGWQKRCTIKPQRLPIELVTLMSQMYMSACNQYVGEKIFDSPDLGKVLKRLDEYRCWE